MESFTLTEAKRWIRRMVITKTAFEADHRKLEAEQQGTVIGVHGQHSAQGDPVICLAVQFWPEEEDALPKVFLFEKRVFDEHLCLSQTVESPVPSQTTPRHQQHWVSTIRYATMPYCEHGVSGTL